VPLHNTTVTVVRMPRFRRLAAIVAAAATAGAVTIALTEDGPAPQVRSIAESDQPAAFRYLDIEANKAASMRALGRQIAMPSNDESDCRSSTKAAASSERLELALVAPLDD
jgi:hypothetical protein